MNISEKNIVKNALLYNFSGEERNMLIRMMRDDKAIYTNTSKKSEIAEDILDCRGLSNEEIINKCIVDCDLMLKYINRYKIQKSYRYSTLYSYQELEESAFENLIKTNEILTPSDSNIILTKIVEKPEVHYIENKLLLLFNTILKSNLEEDEGLEIFHNVLMVFHKDINTMEIRLDFVPNKFKSCKVTAEFNDITIRSILAWAKKNLGLIYENIELDSITNYMRNNKQGEVEIAGQEMINKQNAKSSYTSYIQDGKHILPIIDELVMFAKDNEELFINAPELKNNFVAFIEDIKTTSSYPRTVFCWKIKSVDFSVEFTHNYQGKGYTLLRSLGGNGKMEEMTYVAEYLIQCREDSKGLTDSRQ